MENEIKKETAVRITFENKQRDDSDEEHLITIMAEGSIYHKEKETILHFLDSASPSGEERSFTFTIPKDKNELSMLSLGENQLRIDFREGRVFESMMQTPFGNLPLQFTTQVLDYTLEENEGYVKIHYTMDFNQEKIVQNEVILRYQAL